MEKEFKEEMEKHLKKMENRMGKEGFENYLNLLSKVFKIPIVTLRPPGGKYATLKAIYDLLEEGKTPTADEISEHRQISKSIVLSHLSELTELGWVEKEYIELKEGRSKPVYTLTDDGKEVAENLASY